MPFFKNFFGRRKAGSKEAATERLRLVLIHDRMETSNAFFDDMKKELLGVISKYVEIDENLKKVNFNRSDTSVALESTIAIKNVKRPYQNRERS